MTSADASTRARATFDGVAMRNNAPLTASTGKAGATTRTAATSGDVSTLLAPASITLQATASGADGSVTVVEFYSGTTLLGSDTTSPYFTPASIHDLVDRYVLEIFPAGANPDVDAPLATQDLGRPPVVNDECSADVLATIAALPPGSYIAAVSAQSTQEGTLRSVPSPAFTR